MEPNILLVVMDSVRARNTSLHGHANETTPFLEQFAANRATLYEQARAPGVRSITSHASLFTGLEVAEHRITSADHKLRPGTTVFEQLQDEGYATGAFSENVWITSVDIGLKEGFDHVVGPQAVPFPDAINPRQFVAERGPGQYGTFLRAAIDSGRPLRSILNGVRTKLSSDFDRFLSRAGKRVSSGSLYRDGSLTGSTLWTVRGQPASISWTHTHHTGRNRSSIGGVTGRSARLRAIHHGAHADES